METLGFFGIAPTMTVVEILPGEGWYTEILAPYLKHSGKLVVGIYDPASESAYERNFFPSITMIDMQLEHATYCSLPSSRFPGEQGWYVNVGDKEGTVEAQFELSAIIAFWPPVSAIRTGIGPSRPASAR